MNTALIFPGQGSQLVGMGHDFYSKYDVSREVFHTLDDTIERKLSKLIFSGEEDDLMQTQNSQPSIMATSIAIYKALIYEKLLTAGSFKSVAGHSLGEYSALVVNNGLKFEDSVRLLKYRSKVMQESMPLGTGGMIALIGCAEHVIEDALLRARKYGKIFIANDNAAGQIVLSGEMVAVEYIASNTKELQIKRAIKLPVSAPFHCELIKNASLEMSKEINNYSFDTFTVPLYSNVTAKVCDKNEISNLLVNQIISKVRWREIIENMIKDGTANFIEIGPGNVLSNLVKRISKDVSVISISRLEDMEKLNNINS